METDHIRKDKLADPSAEFVVKLEPAWSSEEDSLDQPSAVYSTAQPMSDTSLLSLDSMHLCYLCPAAFVLVSSLELHMASVHGGKLHMALPGSSTPDRCDAGNCSDTDIDKEVDSHGNRKTSKKKVDDSHTGDKDGQEKNRQHVCDTCGKSFSRPSQLTAHKLFHSGVKEFVCDVCGKSFTLASGLTKHKRVHTEERPYTCPHCDSGFMCSSHLQVHIKSVHEYARPHACDVCGSAFSRFGDLTRHRRIHSVEKPHVCSDCGKGFTQANTLAEHRLTHTGQKTHVCSDCGKGFALPGNLAKHRLTHSGEKLHSCPHCSSAFSRSDILKRHIRRKHQ